jgi:hypothetical protein
MFFIRLGTGIQRAYNSMRSLVLILVAKLTDRTVFALD